MICAYCLKPLGHPEIYRLAFCGDACAFAYAMGLDVTRPPISEVSVGRFSFVRIRYPSWPTIFCAGPGDDRTEVVGPVVFEANTATSPTNRQP